MTCTSERSGIASRGVFFSAQTPPALRKRTMRKTRNLFFALPSIIFSIISLSLLLGYQLKFFLSLFLAGATDCDSDFPFSRHCQIRFGFVKAVPGQFPVCFGGRHSRHRHNNIEANLGVLDWVSFAVFDS